MHAVHAQLAILLALLISACSSGQPAAAVASGAAPVMSAAADQWLGRWIGPEGTALTLSKNGTGYQVDIQSLDGLASFQGRAVDDHIVFERNGVAETIRAATGAQTGMKWLADKKNCLVIRAGEGFCRN